MAEELDELAARLEQVANQPLAAPVAAPATSSRPHTRIQVKQPSSAPSIAIVIIALIILVAAGIAFVLNHSSNEKENLAQAKLQLQHKAQAKETELRKAADLKAAKVKQEQDRLAKHRAEMKRQQLILQDNRKLSEEEDRIAARAKAREFKREGAGQTRKESPGCEKSRSACGGTSDPRVRPPLLHQ
ncbi:hypothetical protein [Rubritalea profundi]|uniref:Uncharacterized protein n=1 Tax=Rubritalea profundi TaxID=1658618 RepID=A0A2S7U2A9_9BACT|nr:hypothetical protein [Rubritalea profundi]PQJ28571.1 hypothetical protein BSZ32_08650 [Rubritalea profundi]